MNMKKISGIVAGVALAFGIAAPASAITINAGDIKITFNAFDAGTVGYGETAGQVCDSIASCDAAAGLRSPGAIGSEDTWGIFSIESITNSTTGKQIFVAGQGGQYLTGVFGGLTDSYVNITGNPLVGLQTLTLSEGGWLNMYLNGSNYNAALGPDGRIGEKGYEGITDVGGTLALSTVFAPSVLRTADGYTYTSTFYNDGITGTGTGYLDVTGGAWADLFDTDTIADRRGNRHDLLLTTSFDAQNPDQLNGWTVDASGHVEGRAEVPEPGSLALLGLGFAGLAGLRRRRAAK